VGSWFVEWQILEKCTEKVKLSEECIGHSVLLCAVTFDAVNIILSSSD
jgi:hypothetical protein